MEVNRSVKHQTRKLRGFNNLIFIVLLLSFTVSSIKLESLGSDLDEDQVSEYAMVLAEQDDETQSKGQKKAEKEEESAPTQHLKIKEHNNLEL